MAEIAYPGTDEYSMAELMTVILAREMAGEEERISGGGANAVILMSAARLAQLTVAPNLWLTVGGGGAINGKFDTLPISTWDPRCNIGSECKNLMMDVVDRGTKGQRAGERLNRAAAAFGGMQVDKYGNVNMIGIGGPYPKLKVRGPGTVGVIWLGSGPNGIFVEHHNKRVFVEKVHYISGAGWLDGGDTRYKLLDNRPGPQRVFTPLCYFDFTDDEHRMRLVSVHPGYRADDVIENTGFELVIPDEVPTTTPPTDRELEILRTRVDRGGRLKTRRVTVG